jgi:class 3 adenylate cyclase
MKSGVSGTSSARPAIMEQTLLNYLWSHMWKPKNAYLFSAVYVEVLEKIEGGQVTCADPKDAPIKELIGMKEAFLNWFEMECSYWSRSTCPDPDRIAEVWDKLVDDEQWVLSPPCQDACSNSRYRGEPGTPVFGYWDKNKCDCPGISIQLNPDPYFQKNHCPANFRPSSMERRLTLQIMAPGKILRITIDKRQNSRWEANLSIFRTWFVIFVLAIAALFFSRDANQLVLMPLERMMNLMKQISGNPLIATSLGRQRQMKREQAKMKSQSKQKKDAGFCKKRAKKDEDTMETVILETTLVKLGSLLALGLGEAGVEMVTTALGAEEFDPKATGKRINGIFCFCEIFYFMDATEVLKHQTLPFVNRIAEIVHAMVDEFHGFPNKNTGEAFLVVWKIRPDETKENDLHTEDKDGCLRLADLSLMFGIKLIASVHKSPVLWEYRGHPGLIARVPNFCVSLGLGLHAGWAVEGALGSEFKIDATYLSPDVNLASRLESATRQFRAPILFSETLERKLSKPMKEYIRWIDRITVVGSKVPLKVFTVDLRVGNLEMEPIYATEFHKVHSLRSFEKLRIRRELRKRRYAKPNFNVASFFREDKDLVMMRQGYTANFFRIFSKGILNYEAGEWEVAAAAIDKSNKVHQVAIGEEDGPGAAVYDFMRSCDFKKPDGWKGYRMILDK